MTFSPQGVMESYKVYDSVIHSDHRCTYSKVNAYLDNPESVKEYEGVGKMLQDFSDLAKQLKSRTKERGHIDFETREPYFILDEKGNPTDIVVRERGWSEQMIEEAMIAANVAVAHELDSHNYPGMYRVHEDPEKEKVESLISMARVLNVPCDLQAEDITPKDIARFLDSIEDEQAKEILSAVAVRAMQKARYSEENLGHYGLALDEYCHFTSPIRRYPDLLIHRMLRRHVIEKKNDDKTLRKDAKKMEKSALHLSEKERDAVTVERAVNDLEAAKYMESRVGQEFDGVITGVTNFGFFVELPNTVEGLVPLRAMDDDFYSYDQDVMMLTGENTGKTFKMGQKVRILVNEVNVPKRQITFTYLQDAVPEQVKEEEIVETKPEEVLELEAPAPVAEEEYPVIEAQFSEPEKAAENETVIPESLPEKEKETEGAA
jgi:ribonuclease R